MADNSHQRRPEGDSQDTNPYAAPVKSSSGASGPDKNGLAQPGSSPGIGRMAFAVRNIVALIVFRLLFAAIWQFAGVGTVAWSIDAMGGLGVAMLGLLTLAYVAAVSVFHAQRLLNIGSNPRLFVGLFIPFLGILLPIRCLTYPQGYEQHKTLDGAAKITIAGIVVGLLLAAAACALYFG